VPANCGGETLGPTDSRASGCRVQFSDQHFYATDAPVSPSEPPQNRRVSYFPCARCPVLDPRKVVANPQVRKGALDSIDHPAPAPGAPALNRDEALEVLEDLARALREVRELRRRLE
jgi:hypothetical protein